jgi:DNA polymerase elongation subunit (family B)
MYKIKRLFFDIETSPNIGLFWSAGYKQNISYENIIKERAIICICYKWEHENKTYSLTWDTNQDDKKLLEKFIIIANEADELVGHNGDKYDLAWIRTRCLYHNIPVFPNYVTIDTLKQARSKFRFNSNRLDYIGKFLGLGEKTGTSFNLWKDIVLNKDKKALDEMVEYCKNDVVLLEKIYQKMSSYFPHKTHAGVLAGEEKYSCPKCASSNMVFSKKRITAMGTYRIQLQCKDCGGYHTVSNKTYENMIIEQAQINPY